MTKVELYDPHPGLAFVGVAAPLPRPMKELADSLDGQVLTLEETIDRITPIAESLGGKVRIVEKHQYISFRIGDDPKRPMHMYRLIRYREPKIQ